MEKTYAVYRQFLKDDEVSDHQKLVLTKFSEDFETEADAIKHLEDSDYRGGDYMILAGYYKHQPDN
jgi:hypothetical protein